MIGVAYLGIKEGASVGGPMEHNTKPYQNPEYHFLDLQFPFFIMLQPNGNKKPTSWH